MDQLTSMQAFCTVAELGSFTAAAEKLEMAKSMVTRHVNALEHQLGVRLLNRTTRKLSRTEAGQAYYERASELLGEFEALNGAMSELSDKPRGTLRVVTPMSFGAHYLGGTVAAFAARYPDVRINLHLSDAANNLIDEGWDVAIRIMQLADSSLVARRISQTRLAVCASPAYLLAHGAPTRLKDLEHHRCLAYTIGSVGGDEWKAEGPEGPTSVRPHWTMRANNGEILRACALEGSGLVLLPTFLIGADLRAQRLVEVLQDHDFGVLGVHAVYPHRRYLSPKVQAFVEHLSASLPPEF